ncbi:hypothetical protein OG792_08075 [Micromonospora sp. NBC_01699]|uniref:hypothetical protein n=1 Tax=Micromonospora sp. NBC_01699 TaxID=2975984 RepID=UPI002E3753DE|nr:hypothetical protein [Micromonospora sp. NBC_01699]
MTAPVADAPATIAPAADAPGRVGAAVERILFGIGVMLLAVTPKPPMMGDGLARYQALLELLEQHQLPGTQYSMIGPLFATPLWVIGHWYGNTQIWLVQYNFMLFMVGLAAIYLLLHGRVPARTRRRFLLLLVGGSMIAAHVPDFYGEVFTATTVGVGLLAVVLPDTRWATRAAGWAAVVLGVANTPGSIVALGLVVGVLCLRRRRVRYLAALPVAAALIIGESWWRFGDPLHSSYAGHGGGPTVLPYSGEPGFSYPFLLGLVAILFSFGKGLVWFTPGLFLPVRERLRQAAPELWTVWLLWAVFVAGLVLLYAKWWGWYGGMYWGPRFFLIAMLPAALALAVSLEPGRAGPWVNVATLGALALSVWGAANSLVYGQLRPWTCYENNYHLEGLCHFTPEFSPLWYPFVDTPELTGLQRGTLVFYAVLLLWLVVPLLRRLGGQVAAAAGGHRDLADRHSWNW